MSPSSSAFTRRYRRPVRGTLPSQKRPWWTRRRGRSGPTTPSMVARLASTAATIRLTSPERFSAWSPFSAASSSGTSAIRRYRSRYPTSSARATELGIDWTSAPGLEGLDRPRDDRIGRRPDPGLEPGRQLAGECGVHIVAQHAAGEAERLDPGLELARLHLARH